MRSRISRAVIPRLSIYYRTLLLHKSSEVVSSGELSDLTGCTPAQIRKDLAYFGQFGTPGRGYIVSDLKKKILEILGIDKNWNVALVGVGNLGTALLSYKGFKEQGFNITAVFDNDLRKIGKRLEGITIQDINGLRRTVKNKEIQMAIVAVPAEEAQKIVTTLIKAKLRAILNFAPIRPQVPKSAELINIDLSIELEKLTHFLRQKV
ncbi:MAG: redox-sensing transcriptional repressor Rex [Candidatus Omnitrophica bacterium]|nr:redox-sensing transcriptional repressor Rex [Candidatus Omnitrophota bacterium]